MANLKVYEWEAQRWPEFRTVILPRYLKHGQFAVVDRLAKRFGVCVPDIGQSYRRGATQGIGGGYYREIKTIKVGVKCTLATLLHEFAHHLTDEKTPGQRAHGKQFKRNLKLCYAAGRSELKRTAQSV